MADPTGTLNARPGDSTNLLLRKILLNLADLPGTFLTLAEGDARYIKLDGTSTVVDGFSLTSAGSIALTAGGVDKNVTITPSGTGSLNIGSKVGLGNNTTAQPNIVLTIGDTPLASGTSIFGVYGATTAPAGTTGTLAQFYSNPRTASGLALGTVSHFRASFSVLGGGGSTIAVQEGFAVPNTMTQGTVNYAFRGLLAASGTARWNLFMDGTAPNRLDGETILFGATATPAGGSTAARLRFGTTADFGIYFGSGAPTVSAAQGSLYLRSDGSTTATRLYVNTNGTTGWTNFVSAT